MKEFVEKLIGRLIERSRILEKSAFITSYAGAHEIADENALERYQEIGIAIDIVKQCAEEYEKEVDQTDYANIELYAFWQKHQWIPCSERLPEPNQMVLTCDKDGWVSVHVYLQYNGKKNDFECGYYKAWMPLPEPYIIK